MEKSPIDIVITWVNDADPIWQKTREDTLLSLGIASDIEGNKDERFQELGLLKYWFRSMERYAPWVRKIHLVVASSSQLPDWLNLKHEKLKIIYHEDIVDGKYLPTFNSNALEWNLHKISGLSERFLYFNDDFYLCDWVKEEDFFIGEKIKDAFIMMALQPVDLFTTTMFNNARILNKYFDKKTFIKKHWSKVFNLKYGTSILKNLLCLPWTYFTGFQNLHSVYPLTIRGMEKIWELEEELLTAVCSHKFRHPEDVTLYIATQYAMLSGEFVPKKVKEVKYYSDMVCDTSYQAAIRDRKYKVICLNDKLETSEDREAIGKLKEAFEETFPKPSTYEL